MKEVLPDVDWEDILKKFSSYSGTVSNFCKENKIGQHRFYYQRKKAGLLKPTTFFPISLDKEAINPSSETSNILDCHALQEPTPKQSVIEISVGKATIRLQDNDTNHLSLILKVLLDIC